MLRSPSALDADVIVIGAGAAGLAAARDLAQKSLKVVVLEGRDRIGGRVWSRSPNGTLPPAELGAEFIHGTATQTMAILRKMDQRAFPLSGDFWWLDDCGLLQRGRGFDSAPDIFARAQSLANDETVDQFLGRFQGEPSLRKTLSLARAFVEGFDAADPAIASARGIAFEWRSGVDSKSTRPEGGYAPIFQELGNDCAAAGAEIRTSTVVRRISWQSRGVAIETDAENAGTLNARATVITLPISLLRTATAESSVVFDPILPAQKRAAIEHIEMGHVVKVALWFRSRFWEAIEHGRYRDAGFFRDTGKPFPVYWTQYPSRSATVIGWVGGPAAIALNELPQSEIVTRALDGFAGLFDKSEWARSEFREGMMHDWSRDPFALGAYSYLRVHAGDAREELGKPLDRTLFFAGEATSLDGQGGTVNGALETGERAAREVAAALGIIA